MSCDTGGQVIKIYFAGCQGSSGGDGSQGPQGPAGVSGSQGMTGVAGPQGAQGPTGAGGAQGNQGQMGSQGVQGAQGSPGISIIGSQGAQGSTGNDGAQGSQGPPGPGFGAQGVQGPTGVGGDIGPQGVQGPIGMTGTGAQGSQGDSGPQGVTGVAGSQGAQGVDGPQGNTGVAQPGPQGSQGPIGIGAQGSQGPVGIGAQGPQGQQGVQGVTFYYPPTPNDDYYAARTNELITMNFLTDPVGIDTEGGVFPGSVPIATVNILKQPSHGTLTPTGPLGEYQYRSNPRFLGMDTIVYSLTDANGIDSKNTATVTIRIVPSPPTSVGPQFLFTGNSLDIEYYDGGVITPFFTATFPTYVGTFPTSVNGLATNRDDNLVYYHANDADVSQSGKVYAYDYVNNVQFLVFNAGSLFPSLSWITGNSNFNDNGAVYTNSNLYLGVTGATGYYYRVTLGPYDPIAVSQQVLQVTQIEYKPVVSVNYGDFAWGHNTNTMYVVDGGGNDLYMVNANTGQIIRFETLDPGPFGQPQITTTYSNQIIVSDGRRIFAINLSNGNANNEYPTIPGGGILSDMAEWYNLPVTL